ncbi:EpsG family protein [Thomasclavelia saccharogumia]|uniref:EpsG family protein n=1 Tax=Thomasclavelia saccharogumia TaxID=341225 RepID=UPI00047D9F80|nr:EpsG family protein [Thomasclavelia saccharogumia]
MAIYSIIYLLNVLSGFVKKNQKKYMVYIVFILLVLLSGTRYYMGGSDVYAYEGVFNNVPDVFTILKYIFTGVNNGINTNYESGYLLINSIIKSLGFNYFGFTLIISILFYFFMYNGLKPYVKDWSIVIAIFMYKLMFYDTFISIRQGLTIAIFFYAIQYIVNKKPIQYFLICFISFCIHRAALFLFPLYFVQYIPISKNRLKNFSLIFLPTIFLSGFVNFEGFITNIISIIGYSEKSEGWATSMESISLIHTLELYLIIIVIIYFYHKLDDNDPKQKIFIQFLFVLIPIFTIFRDWIIFTRLKDYLVISYGILLGYICTNNNKTYLTLKSILYTACLIGMVRYVLVFDGGVFINYDSFIFHLKSIFS